jgi:hypothetical protein
MSDSSKKEKGPRTLADEDVSTERPLVGRRSSLALLGAALVGASAVVAPSEAEAQCTDRDPSDRPGRGRGTGVTDRDSGRGADRAGCGRGGPRTTGITDRDPNDPAGNGRGSRRRCSDSDSGRFADPGGAGRHC